MRTDGPPFMGVYVELLARYLRLDQQLLCDSLQQAGVEILRVTRPVFVDR
jgi:hypothetical protein